MLKQEFVVARFVWQLNNGVKKLNRAVLTKIHMLLAAFVFPVAFMFLVTGGLYTWGVKGSYESASYDIALEQPLSADLDLLLDLTNNELQRLDVTAPTGQAKVKKLGTSFQLEWTGSKRDVILAPVSDPLVGRLIVKETSWYRNFVQLHKAKGGMLFKVYAAILAISLFIILFSGFLMAWQVPKYRRQALIFSVGGFAIFFAIVAAS